MGKFSDKILGAFSLKDDDDYDDDEYFDEDEEFEDEEDYEEDAGDKKGFFSSLKKTRPAESTRREDDVPSYSAKPVKQAPVRRSSSQEVCIFKPSSIEDAREITETLLQGKAVVVNFEGLHVELSQRIIDFISGSCYALDGNLQKISNYIFIATPDNVDISGDFQDLVNGGSDNSFDISGFKSPLL